MATLTTAESDARMGDTGAGNWRCRACDTWNGPQDDRCHCCGTHPNAGLHSATASVSDHEVDAAYVPMGDYIIDVTTAWWSYLAGHAPQYCRERFTTDVARGLAQDVYAHEIEQGANDADAVAAAGVAVVRNSIAAVSDELAAGLAAGLRGHVRQSVTQA